MSAKTILATVAALAALDFGAATHAAPATDSADPGALSVRVSIADLNLDNQAGARIVLQRIRNAASAVCGGEPDIRLVERMGLYQACMTAAVNRGVASVDSPLVTAMNGRPSPDTIVAANR